MRFLAQSLLFALALLVSGAATGLRAQSDETLRIGDIISLNLPGEAAVSKDYQIDRRGRVNLPEVGAIEIRDRSIQAASAILRTALGKAYRDLSRLSVSLKEHKLLLDVQGYVRNPGPVELPGEGSIQMAIMASGGLVPGAQLDRIRITDANGKKIEFDYKQYLDSGDAALLPRLVSLDQIFVPASPLTGKVQMEFDAKSLSGGDATEEGRSVKIFGEVGTPATFAWKPGASVIDIIMRAGGVSRYASVEQIRILNPGAPVVFNLQAYLDSGDKNLLPRVEPGATIFVPKQMEEIRRGALTVYVMGEVAKPGAFDSKDAASFIEILANSGGPTRWADTRQIRIIRADGSITPVDLPVFTDTGGQLPKVSPGDTIFVPEKTETNEPSWLKVSPKRAVQLLGAVVKPGRYEWSDEMSLFDLIAAAGGPSPRGDLANVQVLKSASGRTTPIVFNMEQFIRKGGSVQDVPAIRAGDTIMVPEMPVDPNDNKAQWTKQAPENSIYLMGQFATPGRYAFNTNLGFLDIVTAANGFGANADLRAIRISKRGQKGSKVVTVNLARYFQTGDETLLPKVRPGDVIYAPDKAKDYLDQPASQVVRLMGAIGRPGRYPFNDSVTLLDLLAEAGGPTPDAMQDKIVVVQLAGQRKRAEVFNLMDFVKTGDLARVPLVRAGDLVYIPRQAESAWRKALDELRDGASLLSIVALVNAMKF